MVDCNVMPTGELYKVYSFAENVSINTRWGSYYIGSTSHQLDIDLSDKYILLQADGNGSTIMLSLDSIINDNTINITYIRGTSGSMTGTLKVFVFRK